MKKSRYSETERLRIQAKRQLKQLKTETETENARLKKMYADLSMDHEILKEGYSF